MPARADVLVAENGSAPEVDQGVGEPLTTLRRPNLRGDLDSVLEFLPSFRVALRGYDHSQVDSYVSWAERELRAARRSCDDMAARFAACSAELEQTKRQLARSDAGRDAREISDRVGQILELAAEEAAALTAAGAVEADGLVERARTYAAAMLRRAHEAEDTAAAETERSAELQAAAAAALDRARIETAQLRSSTAAERSRLDVEATQLRERLDQESAAQRALAEDKARRQREQEAAAAAERMAAVHREVDDLLGQRNRARESLRRLTDQIGEALQTLVTSLPGERPNVVDAMKNVVATQNMATTRDVVDAIERMPSVARRH